jgi:hypothetical protein
MATSIEAAPNFPEQRYRDNSPDALYGSILAMEAIVSMLLAERVLERGITPNPALKVLRQQVEAMQERGKTTKYGTGSTLIADGIQDSLDRIFHLAEDLLNRLQQSSNGKAEK